MRTSAILAFIVVLGLAGCMSIPKTDEAGNVVLNPETGEPVMVKVIDEEKVNIVTSTAGPMLPYPLSAALPLLGSLLVAFTRKA